MSKPKRNTVPEVDASSDAALWRRFSGVLGDDAKAANLALPPSDDPAPDEFRLYPQPIIPPDPRRTDALTQNRWRFGMERLADVPTGIPWDVPAPSRHFADRLHRFDWLSALFAGGPDGADQARQLVDRWVTDFGSFHGFYWRLVPTAARVWNWMLSGRELFDNGMGETAATRRSTLWRQVDYLSANLAACPDPPTRWKAACCLVAAALVRSGADNLEECVALLDYECTDQILPDGGLVSRSPEKTLYALADLLVLKNLFYRAGKDAPDFLLKWISRMGAMVQFFRLGDGGLAPFNDGGQSRDTVVSSVLEALGEAPRHFSFAMRSGFQKLHKGDLTLILDCGGAPPRPYAGFAHAGALGFELSDGAARFVTSCAFSPGVNLDWQSAVRGTAAHSTLILAGRDSARLEPFETTRLLVPVGPDGIAAKRLEEADEIWLDAQHSGWKERFGLIHRRRLFLSGDGRRLTGEDSLVRPVSRELDEEGKFVGFDIRFHLHPTVEAVLEQDTIRLVSEAGPIWRFRTNHPDLRLEISRYLGRGVVEKCLQIVMSGRADPNGDGTEPTNCIRWAFRREGGPG
ncbi:MAG: heparinase II/III family protein [Pseudomonadota bacterium]